MKLTTAFRVCNDIEKYYPCKDYTDKFKIEAIETMVNAETTNSISKKTMKAVIRYLLTQISHN